MPGLVDTHCHLYLEEFAGDLDEVIRRAQEVGVTRFYLPAIDSAHYDSMFKLENQYPSNCRLMVGLHPSSVKANYLEELELVARLLSTRQFAGVGEIGLDFHWDKTFLTQQYECFEKQIKWALGYGLPIIIHSRESMQESIDVVRKHQNGNLKGIFHCFSGDLSQARQIVDLGFFLGIGGILTYKNSSLAETLKNIGLDHLVLETDAPYLAPVPYRGKRNESMNLRIIAKKLAEVKSVEMSELEKITTHNAQKIFKD